LTPYLKDKLDGQEFSDTNQLLQRALPYETTKGKNVVIFDDLHNRMIKAHNPEIGVWKENVQRKPTKRVKPTSATLIENYQRQLKEDRRYWVTRGIKRDKFFEAWNRSDLQVKRHGGEPRRTVQHSTNWEPGIRQNPRFNDRSGSGNPDRRVNRPDVLRDGEELSREQEQVKKHVVVVESWPCAVSSEVHING
jgi:hypothetical protein